MLTGLLISDTVSNGHRSEKAVFISMSILVAFIFWLLDSYYLSKEREFRKLYDDVAGISLALYNTQVKDFDMHIKRYDGAWRAMLGCMCSRTEISFYIMVVSVLNMLRILINPI